MLTLDRLIIPENTRFEEGSIVVEGDVIVCPGSTIGYGINARKVILGEKVKVDGDIVGEEVRIDSWCTIKGNVVSRGEAYIADFTSIDGKLTVFGDLDIGRNVRIKEGFEARGLITIQDPLPIIIFVFFYLLELLRLGKLEEAEKLFEELEDEEIVNPLLIPENSVVNLSTIKTDAGIEIRNSRVLGNVRARFAEITDSEVFGSVRCVEDENGKIVIRNSKVHGAVEGKLVVVLRGSEVVGSIKAWRVYVEENCVVEGTITGETGVIIKPRINLDEVLRAPESEMEVKEVDGLNRPEVDEKAVERAMRELRKDPFRFEMPDKIPSAREELEKNSIAYSVELLKELTKEKPAKDEEEVKE